ncbi:SMC5-SMC6 complex localization factor protein 2-like [Lytechinus pictus]|uniref:SMC5-SMC6 complex localization factor protein 2-like n=1 Tax=Lytechinus pictus TaxID=7653 RepID=UPI0030BA265D
MDPYWRPPPMERGGEKILQETHQNRPSHSSSYPRRPGRGSQGRGTHFSHYHGGQQPHPRFSSKPSFAASLNSAQDYNPGRRHRDAGYHSRGASRSHACSSSSDGRQSIPRIKEHPPSGPGMHRFSPPREHYTTDRQKVRKSMHLFEQDERLQQPPPEQYRCHESSNTPNSEYYRSSHTSPPSQQEKGVHPTYRSLASTYTMSETKGGDHSRSHSQSHGSGYASFRTEPFEHCQSRHRGESSSHVSTVRHGSYHSSDTRKRHHSEFDINSERVDQFKEKSQDRSRHRSGPSSRNDNVERKKSQQYPQPRSRGHSESNDRCSKADLVSGRKETSEKPQQRQRSHSESSSKYHHLGTIKKKKSTKESPKVKSPETRNVLKGAVDEDLLVSKQKHTMLWLLNSTSSEQGEQITPSKPVKQKTHDQTVSPNSDPQKSSFIVVEDKKGWAKRIYSDGSSGVLSGMEPVGRSPYSSTDSSGCQKRHGESSKDLHLKKRLKLQKKNSNTTSSNQGGPSYGAILSIAKQNLSNGQHPLDGKVNDQIQVPDRIRRNSHQSGSDTEQRPSKHKLQEGLFDCDIDKVERLFKESLAAVPEMQQQSQTSADRQKLKKQSSAESHTSSESHMNSLSTNRMDEISLEKVGRLFNASLNTVSKTTESVNLSPKKEPIKHPLDEAQSPERPKYTCTLKSTESSSEQSDKHITMSFRRVVELSKKSLAGRHHKFHEKSIKRLRLEACSRAVRIPLKRLRLKSDRIFLTDEFIERLGRNSSSIIVNTARKHNFSEGKKQTGHKHKPRRRALPLCSSSDPDAPSASTSHQTPVQYDLPQRHSLSDCPAPSESSISSNVTPGVTDLFQELSSDPSKTDKPLESSTPRSLQGNSKVQLSPKLSGSISKLKQKIGKRLKAAVQGDRPGCSSGEIESDSTVRGSSVSEGYSFGDADFIPFNSEVGDVIFEETVATEKVDVDDCEQSNVDPLMDTLVEEVVSGASEGYPSPASAACPASADQTALLSCQLENTHSDDECNGGVEETLNEEPLSDGDLATTKTGDDKPNLVPQTGETSLTSEKSENPCTKLRTDSPAMQREAHPVSSPLHETLAPPGRRPGEVLGEAADAAQEAEEGCSGDALDDSESLPDVDINAGDEDLQDGGHDSSSDSMEMDFESSMVTTDDSQPTNTPTKIMKEVTQLGKLSVPGTPSKPYPFPLNDSMSPVRLSQEIGDEEPVKKKIKLKHNLNKLLDISKTTKEFEEKFKRLKQDVNKGGFARQLTELEKAGDGDLDIGSDGGELEERANKLLKKFCPDDKQEIPKVHPGEDVFDQTKLRQIFNYADHMASLEGCGFKPDKPSALESLMLKATADEMVEMLRTFAVEMTYHSKPCPPAFMLWLLRLMSVHTDCNVVNKAYQTMWSILNTWPVQHPDVVPWAPSVAEITQILVNYGASFNELLPQGLVHPEFDESSIRPRKDATNQQVESASSSAADLTDAEKARYHGNNLMKVIKILTLALITRKTVNRFPYTEEEICCLAFLVCKASLETYFIKKAVENDFTLCLVALFACVPEASWASQAERLCHVLPHVTSHHHNLVYITHLMPGCTERGRYISRQLAYMCLKKLTSDEPEQNCNGFRPELKVQYVLDLVDSVARPTKETDYYRLHSIIQILDLAVGSETMDKSEKESLQSLNGKLKMLVSYIKDESGNISKSQVKDLILRTNLRLTLMDQSIISDQVNLFNRSLPLTRIKEENIEEHFPKSQEDAVSISSEEGEDRIGDLDEDEGEVKDHAPDAAYLPEKT